MMLKRRGDAACWPGLIVSAVLLTSVGCAMTACADAIVLVAEKVKPVIADKQESQIPDRIQLGGWIGTRAMANEANRLAKLDPDRLLEGYRKRPGRQIWDGEHIGKWLHAATLAWANTGDAELRKKMDYVAVELAKCQLDDGYLGTYDPTNRWTLWDVWAHKYNLIGLITYMRHTGNLEPLPTCRRMADLLCRTFGEAPGQRDINLAGQHKGMAPTSVLEPMILLYRLTGEPRYLEFCNYILHSWERPNGAKIISTLLDEKRVDLVGNGKAYEMISCFNGALEYYRTVGDKKILKACLNAWEDIVEKRLYLTGTASYREFFHADHDLPNINNVGETCVTVTWLQFNAQLLRLTGEARFAEELERTTLNQLFGAQSCDGTGWGYYVQMQGKKPYSSTLDGHCCLSSGPRGIALIPTFAISADADGVVINLIESATANLLLRDKSPVNVSVKTRYPAGEEVLIKLSPKQKKTFVLKLRVPAWCKNHEVAVNGKKVRGRRGSDGYLHLRRQWQSGDEVRLRLPLKPRVLIGERNNESRLAVLYGPLVLAADSALIESESVKLSELGVAGSDLELLDIKPEPAPEEFRTWPDAQVFRINAVTRSAGEISKKFTARLIPFADAGATGSEYKIWLPYRAPRPDRNLLVDGIEFRSRKPNAGSIIDGRIDTIAATFSNKRAVNDWFGVQMEEPIRINRVVFAHGKNFHDGGWFDTSTEKPYVQVKTDTNSNWKTIAQLEDYPATTSESPGDLKDGQQFVCDLAEPLEIIAIRVVGKPSSGDNPKQSFSTCAELKAFETKGRKR